MSNPPAESLVSPVVVPAEQTRWFNEEVHPHGPHLKNYLKGAFPLVRDVDDVVQESYLRIWKAKAAQPIASARAFLFTIARHLALDVLRRGRTSRIVSSGDVAEIPVLDDRPSVVDIITEQELISLLGDAVVALPERTRTLIILHKFQGVPQAEIARQLGLTEKAVERQVARGVQLCEKFLRSRGHEFF